MKSQKSRPPLTRKILLALEIPSVFFPGLILAAPPKASLSAN